MEDPDDLNTSSYLNISQCVTLRLNTSNYLLWRMQFESFLESQDLLGFVEGDVPQPALWIQKVVDGAIVDESNPAYLKWKRKDKMVLSWLHGSISEESLRLVYGIKTSAETWLALAKNFNRVSTTRRFELQRRLQRVSMDGKPLTEYLDAIKVICDQLASIGFPVTEQERVFTVLRGLGKEYESVAAVIESSIDYDAALLYEDVVARLTNCADRAQVYHNHHEPNSHQVYAAGRGSSFYSRGRGNNFYHSGRFGNQRGRGYYNTKGRGFPQHVQSSSDQNKFPRDSYRPTCQLCGKYGHHVTKCYKRFDPNFQCDVGPSAFISFISSNQGSNAGQEWYPDTRATDHITNNPAHLNTFQEYDGSDSVMVGNGEFLPITHIGLSSLPSTSGKLILENVLVCPEISKSLLSVSKLTSDYPCIFEFDVNGVLVKDKATNQVLAQGSQHKDLYVLRNQQFMTFYSTRQRAASAETWHYRLGHPHHDILNKLSATKSISVTKIGLHVCNSCQMGKQCRLPFLPSEFVSSRILEKIHSDVWGPSLVISSQGFRFYVIL